jgi:serine phosphatase RsbU (regulator of sigma subunit)
LPVSYLCVATIANNISPSIKAAVKSFYCDYLSQGKHIINRLERVADSMGPEFLAKARELKESVVYAERIQRALVPSKKQIIEYLPDNFEVELLYQPKDTISGDFYWAGEGKTGFHFMIGDSTGHGVPGALLSMLGISGVTKLIEERQIEDPARILTCLDNFWYEKLYKTVEKDNRIEDTMEAALCKITEGSNIVELASAMLPIYVVSSKDFQEIAGVKRPIGGSLYGRKTPYKTHKLALKPGDTVYLFSDGFFSQLGSSHNRYKPIGKKRFRQWLQETHSIENLTDRISELLTRYKNWQGDNKEQTDDIVLFALRYVG